MRMQSSSGCLCRFLPILGPAGLRQASPSSSLPPAHHRGPRAAAAALSAPRTSTARRPPTSERPRPFDRQARQRGFPPAARASAPNLPPHCCAGRGSTATRIAALVYANDTAVRGVAHIEWLITAGQSPLYGTDVGPLREELTRARYLLSAHRQVLHHDASTWPDHAAQTCHRWPQSLLKGRLNMAVRLFGVGLGPAEVAEALGNRSTRPRISARCDLLRCRPRIDRSSDHLRRALRRPHRHNRCDGRSDRHRPFWRRLAPLPRQSSVSNWRQLGALSGRAASVGG